MLLEDTKMEKILHNGFRVVSKKPQTLGNILSPSFFVPQSSYKNWLSQLGFFRCGDYPCKSCSFAFQTNSFENFDKSKFYPVKNYINCNST